MLNRARVTVPIPGKGASHYALDREYINYADLRRIVRRNAVLIAASVLAGLLIAVAYVTIQKPIFTARAQLLIDPGISQLPRNVGDTVTVMDTSQVETQMAVLRSERIIAAVIQKLNLQNDPEFVGTPDRWSWFGRAKSKAEDNFEKLRRGMAASQSKLEVRRVGLSYAIDIYFSSWDPQKAALIANEISDSFVREHISSRSSAARQSSEWLEGRLASLRNQMNAASLAVQEFKAKRDYRIVAKSDGPGLEQISPAHQPQISKAELNTLEDLESTATTYRKIYETYLQAYTESVHRQSFAVTIARVITAATRPLQKSHPKTTLVVTLGSLVGALTGLALAFLRHNLDPSVRSARQIRDDIGLQCLGRVPKLSSISSQAGQIFSHTAVRSLLGLSAPVQVLSPTLNTFTIVKDAPFSRFSESMRAIKTSIGLINRKDPIRCIGVTSALASEGKSTIASNLAMLFALADAHVLLVDADARNSTISRVFAPNAMNGLLDAIAGTSDLEQCVVTVADVRPGTANLDVLPFSAAGPVSNITELLGSAKMRSLINCMLGKYDAVVFDLPPAKLVADSLMLGGLLHGVLLVAAENETPLPLLAEIAHDLRSAGANLLGVALTKASNTVSEGYAYDIDPRVRLTRQTA